MQNINAGRTIHKSIKLRRLICCPPLRNLIAATEDYNQLHLEKSARAYRRVDSSVMMILRSDGCSTCVKRWAGGGEAQRTCDTGTQRRRCNMTGRRWIIQGGAVALRQTLQIFQQVAAYVLHNVNEANASGIHSA
jgi:hypothetical protein